MSNGFAAATVLPFGHGGTAMIPSVYLLCLEKHVDRPMSLLTKLQEGSELLGRDRWRLLCTWPWLQAAESPETV